MSVCWVLYVIQYMGWLGSSEWSQNALLTDPSELRDFCETLVLSEIGAALELELKLRLGIVKGLNNSKIDFLVFKKVEKSPFADLCNLMCKRKKYLYRSFSHPSSESCE